MTLATDDNTPDAIDIFVGIKLRSLRHERNLSQEGLGQKLGVSFQQIQKYERGTNRISASRLYYAAQALGVRPEYFFEGMPDDFADGKVPEYLSTWLASERGIEWMRVGACLKPEHFYTVLNMAKLAAQEDAA